MDIHERVTQWHTSDGVSFFRKMNFPSNAVILDFGAGYGEYSIALALSADYTVYAVDKNPKMLGHIQRKMEQYHVGNIILCEADVSSKCVFANDFADAILMYDLIHGNDLATKLPLRFRFFEEAHRILKPHGVLSVAPFECANLRDKTGKRKK